MGVNMGVLPTKGLTLPFMSFGGSGLMANCLALAVLMRIDWENPQPMRGVRAGAGGRHGGANHHDHCRRPGRPCFSGSLGGRHPWPFAVAGVLALRE